MGNPGKWEPAEESPRRGVVRGVLGVEERTLLQEDHADLSGKGRADPLEWVQNSLCKFLHTKGSMSARDSNPRARPATSQDIKAFTHPLRMRLYRLLQDHGQATATMLARETGESSGQTSYHLRQLEKYGFVEEAPGVGNARERWWRAIGFSYDGVEDRSDGTNRLMLRWSMDNFMADMTAVAEHLADEDPQWLAASTDSTHTQWMTAAELGALNEAILALIEEHAEAAKQRHRESASVPDLQLRTSADERRVRIYVHSVALPPSDGSSGEQDR